MDYTEARMLRQKEPYTYQRSRNAIHWAYPRPTQANLSQPNQKSFNGWGMSSFEYWSQISNRKKTGSSYTNLALGGR